MIRAKLNHLVSLTLLATLVATPVHGQIAGAGASPTQENPVVEGTRWSIAFERAGTSVIAPEALRHVLALEKGSKAFLRQMPHLGFDASRWTKSEADGKTVVTVTFTSEDEGKVVITATAAGTKAAPTLSGTAKWTREESTTEFKLTGKPAAALEGTSWALTVTPRPLGDDEEAEDPFEETLTFFGGKAWLSCESLAELDAAAFTAKAAGGGHETKFTLTDGSDRIEITCAIKGAKLTGKLVWSDEESKLLDAKLSGTPAER